VFDTIATEATAKLSAEAMSSKKGGIYCNLMDINAPREDIKSIFFLAYTAMGRVFSYEGEDWPLVPGDYDIAKQVIVIAEELLEQGKIKSHPATVRDGGLEAIPAGMEYIRHGRISGEKLVYVIVSEQ